MRRGERALVEARRGLVEQRDERGVHERDLEAPRPRRVRSAASTPTAACSPQTRSMTAAPDLQRRAVRLAGDVHEPADRLEQQVVARQVARRRTR